MVRYLISEKADINSEGNDLKKKRLLMLPLNLNNLQIPQLVKAGADRHKHLMED